MTVSSLFTRQNLGIFQNDLPKIIRSLESVDINTRTHLSRYTILDRGDDPPFPYSGGFKKIYYCISKPLAAGEFTVHVALRSSVDSAEFQREKRIYSILRGARDVLQPLLIQQLGDFDYLISELFNRGDLISFIDSPEFSLNSDESHWMAYSIVRAVADCHTRGIILRDLKPDNILVRQLNNGLFEIKLIDFGLSFILGEDDEIEAVKICGSPHYISPEEDEIISTTGQFPYVDYSRDLWPLGSILYSLATKDIPVRVVMGLNKKRMNTTYLPETKAILGIFDREIRGLLYQNQKDRPSARSIKHRMRKILISRYPGSSQIQERILNHSPAGFDEHRIDVKFLTTSSGDEPVASTLFSRLFGCCLKRRFA